MLARANIVASTVSQSRQDKIKTDAELMEMFDDEGNEKEKVLPLPTGRDPSKWDEGSIGYRMATFAYYPALFTEGKYESYFSGVIICAILSAGILVGLQTYESLDNDPSASFIIEILNNIILGVFCVECVLKILAEGAHPLRYFYGPDGFWNIFDFLVIIFSFPIIPQRADAEGKATGFRVLSRVARLVRLAKIFKRIPQLWVIIKGLAGGMAGISFIGILLALVFYVYGVAGVLLFRDNDPFHFGTISTALLTLFRAATLENWGDILYIGYFGCDVFTGGIYQVPGDFPALTTSGCVDTLKDYHSIYRCTTPNASPVAAGLYWSSFIVISSLVMLSLFIGVVTMSMQDSMNEMRYEMELASRRIKLRRTTKAMEELAARDAAALNKSGSNDALDEDGNGLLGGIRAKLRKGSVMVQRARNTILVTGSSSKEKDKLRDIRQMKYLMMQAWHGTSATDDHNEEFAHAGSGSNWEHISRVLSTRARDIVSSTNFQRLVTFVIMVTAVVVGIQADSDVNLEILELAITIFYGVEILIRLAAEEFHVMEYLHDSWNVFDCAVWIGSIVFSEGGLVVVLRTLRLLRVLKLVKSLPQLALIVNALIMGLSSIGFIGLILFLAFYMFSVLGIFLFRDNDKVNFGELQLTFLSLFRYATLDNWGGAMYMNMYGCAVYPPPYCGELDSDIYSSCQDYTDAIELNYPDDYTDDQIGKEIQSQISFECGSDFYSDKCTDSFGQFYLSAFYFVFFIVIAALVLLTLFVGVVTTSMDEAAKQQEMETEMERKIMETCKGYEVTLEQLDIYRRVFAMLDLDGGGTIEPAELKVGLRCVNIFPSDKQLQDYVLEIDQNNDGNIDLIEFVVFMTNMKRKNMEAKKLKDEKEKVKKAASMKPMSSRFGLSFRGFGSSSASPNKAGKALDMSTLGQNKAGVPPTAGKPKSFLSRGLSFFGVGFNDDDIVPIDEDDEKEDEPVTSTKGIYRRAPAMSSKEGGSESDDETSVETMKIGKSSIQLPDLSEELESGTDADED